MQNPFSWRKYCAYLLGGLAIPLCGLLLSRTPAAEVNALPAAAAAPASPLDLAACRGIALEKQPSLAAAHASLAAAQARKRGLDHLFVPALELPIRRQQAAKSVVIAQAVVTQTEWETVYAVTRTYFAAVYAQEQLVVVDQRLEDLKLLRDAVQQLLDTTAGNVTTRDKDKVAFFLPMVQGRREEALQGHQRALAALREAMGVGPHFPLQLADSKLPAPSPTVTREEILTLALDRRGELIQAGMAAAITADEVKAQKLSYLPTARTFASAGDIHTRPVPQGISNDDYRPGALSLEMPVTLAGTRHSRVEQARALHTRAQEVIEKTRGLIALEADDAYLRALEAARKLPALRDATTKAEKLTETLREDMKKAASKVTPDQVLGAGVLATDLRVRVNEALYQYLIELAALERITAGGFCPGFDAPGPKAP